MNPKEISLFCTSVACPEEYEALDGYDGNQIAYFRLRHGVFTVECPDVGGTCVYRANVRGDGSFEYNERARHLDAAKQAVARYYSWK